MKKNMLSFVLLIAAIVLLATGCGKAKTVPKPIATTDTESSNPGEGKVADGIKDESEIISLQNEERETDINLSANTGNSESGTIVEATEEEVEVLTPVSCGPVDPADYWQGEDYFDLAGYLNDNGFYAHMYSRDLEPVDENPYIYLSYYKADANMTWMLWVNTVMSGDSIILHYAPDSHRFIGITTKHPTDDLVTVDEKGTKVYKSTISNLPAVVDAIKADPTSYTPLSNDTSDYAVIIDG